MSEVPETHNDVVRDVRQYASYPTAAGNAQDAMNVGKTEPKESALNLDELSAKEIDAYVNSGDLTAEQVYEYESNAATPRKGVLHKYAPKQEEAAPEAPAEDDTSN